MEVSKLDAAKRQLDVAIILFFKQSDPVSVHTLTAAAHQLLMDVGCSHGIKSFMKQNPLIKEEKFKEYISVVNKAENFFKHAKNDAKEMLDFDPGQTEYLMLDAVEMYMQLTNEMPEDMSIFRVWFLAKNPNLVTDEIKRQIYEKGLDLQRFMSKTKLEFFSSMKDALLRS